MQEASPGAPPSDHSLPLTADGKLHLMINSRVTGPAAEVHRSAVASTSERFGEELVGAALREGRTYAHISLVYDFYLEPSQLPRLEAALHTFASEQQATLLTLLQPVAWDGRVVCLHPDVHSAEYAAAREIYSELLSVLSALDLIPAQRLTEQVPWHATIAMRDEGDSDGFEADAIVEHVRGLGLLPAPFLFDNVTLMVKEGPPGPYRCTATPARTFPFARSAAAAAAVPPRGPEELVQPGPEEPTLIQAGAQTPHEPERAVGREAAGRRGWVLHEEWVVSDGTTCTCTTPMPPVGGRRPGAAPEARSGAAVSYSMRRGREEVHRLPCALLAGLPTCAPRASHAAGIAAHEARLQEAVRYRPSDIVIATFPKCGTTFVEQIVLLLLGGGVAEALDPLNKNSGRKGSVGKVWPEGCLMPDEAAEPLPYPPGRPQRPEMRPMSLSAFDALPSPRVLKTHAPVSHLLSRQPDGTPAPARYIVVTRNPLDACVSCYYHAWHPQSSGWPFDAHALAWLDGRANSAFGAQGTWFDFYAGWHAQATCFPPMPPSPGAAVSPVAPVVLWLHYEALLRDPAHEVRAIATFLGLDATDAALIARVVEGSSFTSMREAAVAAEGVAEGAKGVQGAEGAEGAECATAAPSYEVPGKAQQLERRLADHLRKGEVGDWRQHCEPHPELLEAFEAVFAREMRGCAGRQWDCGGGKVMAV